MTEETAKALIDAMDRLTKAIQEDKAPLGQLRLPIDPVFSLDPAKQARMEITFL